jgi:hypothetical protein
MHSWKLLLTALGTGAFLGTVGGTTLNPVLKPPPEQPWRQGLGPQHAPVATYEIVDAAPQDLTPQGLTYGAARAFPQDRFGGARGMANYRYDDPPAQPDDGWRYAALSEDEPVRPAEAAPVAVEAPAAEAAEAALDAARDAQDQEAEPVAAVAAAIPVS